MRIERGGALGIPAATDLVGEITDIPISAAGIAVLCSVVLLARYLAAFHCTAATGHFSHLVSSMPSKCPSTPSRKNGLIDMVCICVIVARDDDFSLLK